MTTTAEDSQLGKATNYGREYSPNLLDAISRGHTREQLPFLNLGRGFDYWHLFELSWLDATGKPQVAIGRLSIPAGSPNIVESKSLKLYANSLNFKAFASSDDFRTLFEKDVSRCIKAQATLELLGVDELPITRLPNSICLDDLTIEQILVNSTQSADASLLALTKPDAKTFGQSTKVADVIHFTHLFRSNCPVTNQPDWASVLVRYSGEKIDEASLLAYLVSYREHQGFHESCVEQIYADILSQLKPTKLMVQAWFTRRGGIDISPCRATHLDWVPKSVRLARQ